MYIINLLQRLILCVIVVVFALSVLSAQKRIYVAPDDHTDYVWTADANTYNTQFGLTLDYYLDRMNTTVNAQTPSPYQTRWNTDGSLWMWTYERNRPGRFDEFINRVKSGHLSVPLNPLVLVNGGTPAEAVLRGMYYPGLIERHHNVRFPLAAAVENQAQPYGLSSLWAGAGAKYSWKGVCGCANRILGLDNRDREIYYCGGLDGSRVLMKWNSKLSANAGLGIGSYAEARDVQQPTSVTSSVVNSVNYVDTNPAFTSRYSYPVIGVFGYGQDDFFTHSPEFETAAQTSTNLPSRQVINSNQIDFFQDFEANYGSNLETFAASYGNEWELYVASMQEVSARVKRATEKLRAAEAMTTLVSLQNSAFMNNRIVARDEAMLNLGLYFEHDWTADGPVGRQVRADWQKLIESKITNYVDALHQDSRLALGGLIRKSGTNIRFFVFNPLSWSRTDYADFAYTDTNPVHVVDVTTNQEVPSQIVMVNSQRRLRILASDIPSVGYKAFEIRPGAGTTFTNAATVTATATGSVIENATYRITVSKTGAVTSLIDKTRGNREFIRNLNGYTANDLNGSRTNSGTLTVENAGAVSITIRATSTTPLAHTSRITLIRNAPRIEIQNNITQNFGDVRTWSFSFNLNNPNVWHEEVGAIIRAKLLTSGGHYSPKNARYDWLTLNHFADMSDGNNTLGITLSNADAYYMRLGGSTTTALDTATPQINVLAGGQVDGTNLGIRNQNGDSQFLQRFALVTHNAFNKTAAMRFALEHQNPFVTGAVTGSTAAAYPETDYSLINITNPNVLLWALKPAEDGIEQGVAARVWNIADSNQNFALNFANSIQSAKRTTHIETDLQDATVTSGALTATAAQQQLQTYRLIPNATPPSNQLPANWTAVDVGNTAQTGTQTYVNGTYTIEGGGGDVWGNADDFRFVYQSLIGDGQITARVTSIENTDGWAKAGVMMRQSLSSDSINAAVVLSPNDGPGFQRRLTAGATTIEDCCGNNYAPYWVRLVRRGNTISGYKSANGTDWTLINSDTVNMTGTIYVGLMVSAHNNNAQLCTATFDNVAFATPASTVVQINSGGISSGGFVSDYGYSAGNTFDTNNPINVSGIADPAPAQVYQSLRYGNFNYTIGSLVSNANYTIRLHFAENYWGVPGQGGGSGAGKRLMNITINGTRVESNFDIYQTAGAANKAVVKEFAARANAAGQIVIAFAPPPNSPDQNAQVNGIEIIERSETVPQ